MSVFILLAVEIVLPLLIVALQYREVVAWHLLGVGGSVLVVAALRGAALSIWRPWAPGHERKRDVSS